MTTPLKTRILVADDHPIVLRGLRMVLNAQPDLEVVAEATDGDQAVELALSEDVHLAILDISMPRTTGLQATREITRRKPELRVLILSMHDSEQYLFEAIRVGASGYVLKSAVDRDLVEACRAAMRGEPFLYPGAVRALMRDYLERAGADDRVHGELPREARDARPRRAHALRDPPRPRRAVTARVSVLIAEVALACGCQDLHFVATAEGLTDPALVPSASCSGTTCGPHPIAAGEPDAHTRSQCSV
jgi:DNA-binding NarL/FixJ family response regulator